MHARDRTPRPAPVHCLCVFRILTVVVVADTAAATTDGNRKLAAVNGECGRGRGSSGRQQDAYRDARRAVVGCCRCAVDLWREDRVLAHSVRQNPAAPCTPHVSRLPVSTAQGDDRADVAGAAVDTHAQRTPTHTQR